MYSQPPRPYESATDPVHWSRPMYVILEGSAQDGLETLVGAYLSDPKTHVCAIAPATRTPDGYLTSLVYQERLS